MADTKVEKILEALITHAAGVIDADCWYVALYNKITAELDFPPTARRVMAALNMDEERWISRPYRPSDFLPDRIFADAKTVLIERDLKGWLKTHKAKLYQTDTPPLSWLGVPLMARGKVLGVVVAENYRGEPAYEDKTREFLSAMVQRAAGALANARLVESLRAASEVGQRLTSGIRLSRDEILELIYEQASRLMDTRNMYVALYDEEKQELSFPLAMQNGERKSWSSAKVNITIGAEGGLSEVVIRTKSPLCPLDVEAEYQKRAITPRVPPIPKSWLGVPMMIENRVIGVIALQNDDVMDLYGPDDQEVLQTMAAQAAVAIENARLYREVQRHIKELESTREQLVDAERLLVMTRFATDFIHRVNNMVGTIPIWTQQIQARLQETDFKDDDINNYLSRISTDVKRVRDVTTQLIEATKQKPSSEMLDLVDLMQTIARRIRVMTPDEVSIVENYPIEPAFVYAVRIELETTLWDIAWNGVQAIMSVKTGTLALSVDHVRPSCPSDQGKVRVEIHDDGIGVPQGLPVFETLSSTKEGGLGYGLWRAKKVVEESGGGIGYKSVPGDTTFWIELPEVIIK